MSFFKNLRIFIFSIIYGKVNGVLKLKNNKKIEINKVVFSNKFKYNIYKVIKPRVFHTSVHDKAVIIENKVIDKISYQYRYNKKNLIYNSKVKNNIIFKNGFTNLKKKIKGCVFSTLTGGAGKDNYFHWLFDVLPRLAILEKSKFKHKKVKYLFPSLKYPYQLETINELKIPLSKSFNSQKFKHFICDELLLVDHPYVFNNNPTKSILNIPSWIINWLRLNFINQSKKKNNNFDKIYIDRSDSKLANSRYIINDNQLKKNLTKLNFKILKLSNYKFTEQVNFFKNAKIIIGLHGAGFANIIFSRPGTKIIELQTRGSGNVIKNLALKCKLKYKRMIRNSLDKSFSEQNGNILVDIKKLNKLILN